MWQVSSFVAMGCFAAMQLIFAALSRRGMNAATVLAGVFGIGALLYGIHLSTTRAPLPRAPRDLALIAAAAALSYVGNWLLWTGFAFWSRLLWMVPVAWAIFFAQYRAIAAWEAEFIRSKYPGAYDDYARQVRPWMPRWPPRAALTPVAPLHPWREVFFSERGTLIAVVLMAILLSAKLLWKS